MNKQTQDLAIPDGWQLVPKRPTKEMMDAAACTPADISEFEVDALWAEMLAAAALSTPTSQP